MKKFNHTAHKELWDWLAKNPDKAKSEWPCWDINCGIYSSNGDYCFACEYADARGSMLCRECPLIWPVHNCCSKEGGLYDMWTSESEEEARAGLAEQIRDLPVREGVECV